MFSRKPIFGYPFMVFSGIAIGFMGWGVWAHHMFASGLGPISVAAFSVSTMFIAVPTGVKILNWMATMWGGKLTFTTPMLFAIGLVAMFTIGGLSGVTHAVAPADTQQTDTYYIVAHFHYVLFGGALFGFFGGFYFWWPKVFGYMLNETLGQGALLAHARRLQPHLRPDAHPRPAGHAPPHLHLPRRLRLQLLEHGGHDRRVHHRPVAAGVLLQHRALAAGKARRACPHPAPTRGTPAASSGCIPSPTPEHNFDDPPVVTQLDDFWHRKYGEDETGTRRAHRRRPRTSPCRATAPDVHLPSPSYWPLVLAAGLPFIGYGLIFNTG